MTSTPYPVKIRDHPGSTLDEIWNEPEWISGRGTHRIGYTNHQDRQPGFTHGGDEAPEDDEEPFEEEAIEDYKDLEQKVKKGELINFRDIVRGEKDFHLRYPDNRSIGWRFVLNVEEDWVKNKEDWPANQQKRKKEEEAKKLEEEKQHKKQKPTGSEGGDQEAHADDRKSQNDDRHGQGDDQESQSNDGKGQCDEDKNVRPSTSEEHDWKKSQGENMKHNDAYVGHQEDQQHQSNGKDSDEKSKSEYEKLRERYSPQEIALLRSIQNEKDYVSLLKQCNGKGVSPMKGRNRSAISIDEADQFSPDNWIPRSNDLIRLTGKHPLNAEAHLSHLYEAGLITPNELHYVRNHGAVPHILWEFHKLDIENGTLVLSMDDIKNRFDTINIPVALACDGNRRKELNMIKKSKGFSWGSGAVGCAYWKGPLVRDILLAAGVPEYMHAGTAHESTRYYVNFEGVDELSEGRYSTCIPFQYAMDPANDVILAYEMNNEPLPPDHGYPLRLLIPGYVGGRCVKWLGRIWISDRENDSHYHIWDNRVLPSFVTEKDGEFAKALFSHPDTACNEQNLNSVIVKPAQGERIFLSKAHRGMTYRIEGYAYDGGGHEVQRVEVSLDDGETWLYCIRRFPDAPIRHGNKFWSWVHWHVDTEVTYMLSAKNIIVRCFNVFKNTQPREPSWNTMGMMNNCWYTVLNEITTDKDSGDAVVLFRHPTEPGTCEGGWMKPSTEVQIAAAKQQAGTPQKQFTRQEIEKHTTENDCWLVIDGKVYDATSVLSWHPGGKAAILGHAGKVHQETSDEFASIHDDFAAHKLKECILGTITDKANDFIRTNAEAKAKELANSCKQDDDLALQKHRWVPVKLKERKEISKDTRTYTFRLPDHIVKLGLGTCQHVQIGFHLKDRMVIRSYTPTRPLLPAVDKPSPGTGDGDSPDTDSDAVGRQRDGVGTFDLTVKTYFPTASQPGGALSNILDCVPIGEEVEIRGPTGDIVYNGNGCFDIDGQKHIFKRVNLVLGGSGITPGYSLIARILLSHGDKTEIRAVDANKSEADILLKDALDGFEKKHPQQFRVTHVLSHPSDDWKGEKGHVHESLIKDSLFEPVDGKVACFLCGPPAMIQKAALPALKGWGFEEDKTCWGF